MYILYETVMFEITEMKMPGLSEMTTLELLVITPELSEITLPDLQKVMVSLFCAISHICFRLFMQLVLLKHNFAETFSDGCDIILFYFILILFFLYQILIQTLFYKYR